MTVQIQCSEALMLVPLYKIDDPDDAREREGYLGDIGKDLYKLLAEEYAATHKRSSVSAEKFRIAVKQVAESHRESGEVATWGKYFLSRYPRLAQRIWDENAANSGGVTKIIWRRLFSIVIESAYYELVCYKKVLALSQADGISVRFDGVAKVKAVLKRHFKKNMGFVPELPDTEESPITPQKGIAELFPLE